MPSSEGENPQSVTSVHLWDVKHDYYCNEVNYFNNDTTNHYDSLAEFLENEGDSDMDYNLLFRWDWKRPDPDDYDEDEPKPEGDELWLFWVGQRKGLFRSTSVMVQESDEDQVIEWLKQRLAYLLSLWEPLT